MYKYNIGIDIGKEEFVVALHGDKKTYAYGNTRKGIEEFLTAHDGELKEGLVVLEATGGYEGNILKSLHEKKFKVHKASGRQIKSFILSYGKYAKTDRIDALAIAKYSDERGSCLSLHQPIGELEEQLSGYTLRRMDLIQAQTQEKNRLKSPVHMETKESIQRHIKFLEGEILAVEQAIEGLLSEAPEHSKKVEVLETIPGIGKKTAIALIALLPELGSLNNKQIACLSGLAPQVKESGKRKGYASTAYGGRRSLRPILFLSAMSAGRSKGALGVWYRGLVGRGKKKMVALVALMRKIIVIANARLRDFYQSQHKATLAI